jgi:hypothetical protein
MAYLQKCDRALAAQSRPLVATNLNNSLGLAVQLYTAHLNQRTVAHLCTILTSISLGLAVSKPTDYILSFFCSLLGVFLHPEVWKEILGTKKTDLWRGGVSVLPVKAGRPGIPEGPGWPWKPLSPLRPGRPGTPVSPG